MASKRSFKTVKAVLTSALALGGAAVTANDALAVSLSVQLACATDYYAHCSAYSPDSPQVRKRPFETLRQCIGRGGRSVRSGSRPTARDRTDSIALIARCADRRITRVDAGHV
jgi:hypothetical protein